MKNSKNEKSMQAFFEWNLVLGKIDTNLGFEIDSTLNDWKPTLILTANWVLKNFPYVDRLYELKSDIDNCNIEKYRSAKENFNSIKYNENLYKIEDFYVALSKWIDRKENKKIISMEIFYNDLNNDNFYDVQFAWLTLLDHNLWEYYFTTKIRWPIDFYQLQNKVPSNIFPMKDITLLKPQIDDFIED